MEYTLVRSKRKTTAIYIRDGGVEVRAPLRMPVRDIEAFLAEKQEWISAALARAQERARSRAAFSLTYGDVAAYRGARYPILAGAKNRVAFDGAAFRLPPGLPPEGVKAACVRLYRQLAANTLPALAGELAQRMGVSPAAVKINGAQTRWGSCSGRGNLNFSWRLMMADDGVIAYVVVHELAHLREMNHSPRFWAVVEEFLPDYRARKERLTALQLRLAHEDWG